MGEATDLAPGSIFEEPARDAQPTDEYEPHLLALLFPAMSTDERHELEKSVQRAGALRHPITLYEGKILDGWHRYQVCCKLGLRPTFIEFEGPGTPEEYVVDANLCRRHLGEGSRALIAAKMANLGKGRPGKNARTQAFSQADAAKKLKVGRSSVQDGTKVLKSGIADLVHAVEQERISVSKAATVANEGQEEQAALLAEHLAEKKLPRRSKKVHSTGTKPDQRTSNPAGAKTNSSSPRASSPHDDDAPDADQETTAQAGVEADQITDEVDRSASPDAQAASRTPRETVAIESADRDASHGDASETADTVDATTVAIFVDRCREIDEDMPEVIVAVENGLGELVRADLRRRVSVVQTALSKVAGALERTETTDQGEDD
jgi:hypothetical protein